MPTRTARPMVNAIMAVSSLVARAAEESTSWATIVWASQVAPRL